MKMRTPVAGRICRLLIFSGVLSLCFQLAAIYSFAQPTITNFSPVSDLIGTTVIITGTNFSTTPANNIVFFGATQATVTNASSTSLDVIVPTGATYQPISVTVGGLTSFSNSPFVVTFPGGGIINACSEKIPT